MLTEEKAKELFREKFAEIKRMRAALEQGQAALMVLLQVLELSPQQANEILGEKVFIPSERLANEINQANPDISSVGG